MLTTLKTPRDADSVSIALVNTDRSASQGGNATILPTGTHLDRSHPLAEVAAKLCRQHSRPRVGRVACGACWEQAIRIDERFVVECGLPREIEPDPEYVDEVAVSLACRGERVTLTAADLPVAVRRLRGRGLFPIEIARRLHVAYGAVTAVLAPVETATTSVGRAA